MFTRYKSFLARLWSRFTSLPAAVLLTLRLAGKHLIVIHIQEAGLYEHIHPVIKWLAENSSSTILVIVRKIQMSVYTKHISPLLKNHHNLILATEECFANVPCHPRFILSMHPEAESGVARRFRHLNIHRIVMHHGFADKYINEKGENSLACYTGFFLFGPASRDGSLKSYAHHYPDHYQRLKLFNIGCPKTDQLLKDKIDRVEFLSRMGLDPDKKVVCYAPTYQRSASLEEHGIDIIKALAGLPVNVIVKLHHVSLKTASGQAEPWVFEEIGKKNWAAILSDLENKYHNIRLAKEQNANPYLQISDVLISDVSGVAFEYLMLDRAIVFYDVPDFFSKYGTQGLNYWGRTCGDIVNSPEALSGAVQYALNHPEHKKTEREAITRKVTYNKGFATEHAGRTILELSNSAPASL